MALGNFAHSYGQSCSSLWVNLPIVVGKLYSCTSSFIIIVIFLARTLLLYIYSTVANGEVKISLHLPSIMQGINAEPLTKSGKRTLCGSHVRAKHLVFDEIRRNCFLRILLIT